MTYSDETLHIDTPENVAFGYDLAGIGSRFMAALVDTSIIIILEIIVTVVLLILIGNSTNGLEDTESSLTAWMLAVGGLFMFVIYWGYYIFFEMLWNGQSPGKRLVGLRVLRIDGTPITLAESIIRNLVRLIDLLPSFYGVGVVTMFINEQSRRLGDLTAGTLVVHDRGTITLEGLESSPGAPQFSRPVQSQAPDLPVERLTPAERHLVEDFIRRREGLANRQELAVTITQALFGHLNLAQEPILGDQAEKVLERIALANYQQQQVQKTTPEVQTPLEPIPEDNTPEE